ncbi:hypothetical protein BH23ACT12_BH23ACT12_17490 [soil metagenome]
MFFHVQKLINSIIPEEPDPAAANALQEGLGGQFGEMRTMMQYLFQGFNFRGDATPYKDLIQGIGTEEISHVELIATTINRLLDGSPAYSGKNDGTDVPGAGGKTPLDIALGKNGNGKNREHPLLPGRGPGRPAGRLRRQPVARLLCLQQRQFGSRPPLQPHAGGHRPDPEVPAVRDNRQRDGPVHDFLPNCAPERPEEFSPGLTPELKELVDQIAAMA